MQTKLIPFQLESVEKALELDRKMSRARNPLRSDPHYLCAVPPDEHQRIQCARYVIIRS